MTESTQAAQPVEIFISYSHKDEKLRDRLLAHLANLRRRGLITEWHDRKILPAMEWADEIDKHLNSAQVILLLVSADFIASDYCYGAELQRAMQRHEAGEARVIPIILRPVELQGTPFMKLQALPKNAKPVTKWPSSDEAFSDVTQGVRKVVEEIQWRSSTAMRHDSEQSSRGGTRKILVLAANPANTSQLRLSEEIREIEEGLRRAKERDLFSIETRLAVRTRDLRRAMLDSKPNIIHFSGHGIHEGIILESPTGHAQLVSPEALSDLFELFTGQVECVMLNACYSALQAEAISRHISYVIGMSAKIGDRAAIEFAVGFYDALGAGRSIEEAFKFGRNAIRLQSIPEHLTPVLHKQGSPPFSSNP